MAVPKRRTSKARKRKRRTHWKLSVPGTTKCAHCGQTKMAHTVCPHCGYYAGREVIRIDEQL